MSQNAIALPTSGTLPGLTAVNDINSALDTLNTDWSGGAAPSSPETGQRWLDTSTSPPTRRYWTGTQWVAAQQLDDANALLRPKWVPFSAYGAKTASYAIAATDHGGVIGANFSTSLKTITLPAVSAVWAGFVVTVINVGTTANITQVQTSGSDGINIAGAAAAISTLPLPTLGAYATFMCAGSGLWLVVSSGIKIACDVTKNDAQSIPNATGSKLQLKVINYDYGGFFDGTTNFRYTPTVPGLYFVSGRVTYNALADGTWLQAYVYKNGSTVIDIAEGAYHNASNALNLGCQGVTYMSGTDYVELWTYQAAGGSAAIYTTANHSKFSAVRI